MLGRNVEYVVLHKVLQHACAVEIQKLVSIYLLTERNMLIADHFADTDSQGGRG